MSGNNISHERRQHKRVSARFIVIYKVNEPLEVALIINKRQISAIMLDLSEGGMALVTGIDIPVETVLLMNFTLINTAAFKEEEKVKTMDITGNVRYSLQLARKEYRLGINFTRISNADRLAIASFVQLTLDKSIPYNYNL